MEIDCTLRRRSGTPIECRTVDVGPGGMCVASPRPLATDEELTFELAEPPIEGRARVLRQQGLDLYAVRFENLREPSRAQLERLATAPARDPGAP
jgi:hypothetical protein